MKYSKKYSNKWLTSFAICTMTFFTAFMLVIRPSVGQESEEMEFTNLQLLPEDIGEERLIGIMNSWEDALGVGCDHCHEAYGRDDPRNDFASDSKLPKLITRVMMQNLFQFNQALTPEALEKSADEIERAQCSTCHQGNTIPPVFEAPAE
jgi:hypothetical protein